MGIMLKHITDRTEREMWINVSMDRKPEMFRCEQGNEIRVSYVARNFLWLEKTLPFQGELPSLS
jgi:hypothetical protein